MPEEEYKRVTEPGYRADFRLVPLWGAVMFSGLVLNGVLVCCPDVIPYSSLGPVGSFLHTVAYDYHFLIGCIFWVAIVIHIGEGVYQWILCRRYNFTSISTLFWVGQTTIFGFPSLLRFKQCLKKTD